MLEGQKIVVVMPAYNASSTIQLSYKDLPHDIVDEVIVVDDKSSDDTLERAKLLGVDHLLQHNENMGYGANQKTCYKKALEIGADIVIMVHPDYQYNPKLVGAMAAMIASGVYDCVIGSRILTGSATRGGMPKYKYIANRFLTVFQNILIPFKLSEYHSGFRGYSANVISKIDFDNNSDDFLFDNQFLLQIIGRNYRVGELSCPTKYDATSSSIDFSRSVKYGLGVLSTTIEFKLAKIGVLKNSRFNFNQPEPRSD